MAYKILGQVAPSSTGNVNLYTVPDDFETVVSTLHLNNTVATSSRVSVYVRKFSATLAAASSANALLSSVLVSPGQPLSYTIGVTLSEKDTITVSTESASSVTFHLFGSESI
jgi:hypothetical protein